ncbi:hypothetical protein QBC39DRAFT_184741 [Podospora conica]|nr:hypothetical protein QBC39DRAFT_184741 [Schizothecium conicum]
MMKNDEKQTTPVAIVSVVVEIHGGRGKGEGGEEREAQLIARVERVLVLAIESSDFKVPSRSTTARGVAAPKGQFRKGCWKLFFEAFGEGEVGDASPWWAGTVRADVTGRVANMPISRSLRGVGQRGSTAGVDPVFVQTASLSRPPTSIRESCRWVSSRRPSTRWGEERKRVDSQKLADSSFGQPIRAGATHGGAVTAGTAGWWWWWWCWSDTGEA